LKQLLAYNIIHLCLNINYIFNITTRVQTAR